MHYMHFYKCLNLNVCWQCVYTTKSLPLSHIEPILDACLCDIAQTEAPPTIVDWQKSFSTDCTGVLPQTRPVWAVISCFNAGADVDKNDS